MKMEVSGLSIRDLDSFALCQASSGPWRAVCHKPAGVGEELCEEMSWRHTGFLIDVSGKGST